MEILGNIRDLLIALFIIILLIILYKKLLNHLKGKENQREYPRINDLTILDGSINLKYQLPYKTPLVISVLNAQKNALTELFNDTQTGDKYEVSFDISSLNTGSYFLKFTTEDQDTIRQFKIQP